MDESWACKLSFRIQHAPLRRIVAQTASQKVNNFSPNTQHWSPEEEKTASIAIVVVSF